MQQICVGALLVRRDEGLWILLGRRSVARAFFPDVWDVPGGHCEPGETPEQALFRELYEEVGVLPTAWRLLERIDVPAQASGEAMSLYFYEVTAWTGRPS